MDVSRLIDDPRSDEDPPPPQPIEADVHLEGELLKYWTIVYLYKSSADPIKSLGTYDDFCKNRSTKDCLEWLGELSKTFRDCSVECT